MEVGDSRIDVDISAVSSIIFESDESEDTIVAGVCDISFNVDVSANNEQSLVSRYCISLDRHGRASKTAIEEQFLVSEFYPAGIRPLHRGELGDSPIPITWSNVCRGLEGLLVESSLYFGLADIADNFYI